MEILVFTLNAVLIYLLSDWLVRQIEQRRGAAMPYRQVVFFGMVLTLALLSFAILKQVFASP